MKKIMYIQPTIEVVKLQQSQSICGGPSPVISVGGDVEGGEEGNPLDL